MLIQSAVSKTWIDLGILLCYHVISEYCQDALIPPCEVYSSQFSLFHYS